MTLYNDPGEIELVIKNITTEEESVYLKVRSENLLGSASNKKDSFRLAQGGKSGTFMNELQICYTADFDLIFTVPVSKILIPVTVFGLDTKGKAVSRYSQSLGFSGFTKNGVPDNADGENLYAGVRYVIATLQVPYRNEIFFGSGKVATGIDTRGILYILLQHEVFSSK